MFLQALAEAQALLNEPSYIADGLTDDAVAETITETKTFLRNPEEANSNVALSRTVERNASQEIISSSAWAVTTCPIITDIETDQANDETIALDGETVLTITGSNFGEDPADLTVIVRVVQDNKFPHYFVSPNAQMATYVASITSVDGAQEVITASITFSPEQDFRRPTTGRCRVQVLNRLRHLASDPFDLTTV